MLSTTNHDKEAPMADKSILVYCIYPTFGSTEFAVDILRLAGFRSEDISVLFPANIGSESFIHVKNTKTAEGASAGAGTGAMVRGALGWLVGMGTLAIPGLGSFIAAGPIMDALAGAGVGGTGGGIAGALTGMGIPEYEALWYEGLVNGGSILLSVHSDDSGWAKQAKEILEGAGAEHLSSVYEAHAEGFEGYRPLRKAG
jgi:hypothetical protein